jgi:hypothetical protein
MNPGSGIGFFRIPDIGSQTGFVGSLLTNFWVKGNKIISVLAKKCSLPIQTMVRQNFMIEQSFFPSSFGSVVGSIREPRSGMDKNTVSGINIPDP